MKKLFLTGFFLLALLIPLAADEPLLDPDDYTVYSKNGKFFLSCNAEEHMTSCYEIHGSDSAELKWQIPRWTRYALVSDDGYYCILDDGGADGLIQSDYTERTALFSVYEDGNLLASLTVGEVYDKPVHAAKIAVLDSKTAAEIEEQEQKNMDVPLQITVSHYKWGTIEELYNNGILLMTSEGYKWYSFVSEKVLDCSEIMPSKTNASCNELKKKFDKAKNLISNKEDGKKLSSAVEAIIKLSKFGGYKIGDERYGFDFFEDEDSSLRIEYKGGAYKGAGGHKVKVAFYYETAGSYINFFLTDDGTSDLYIDISGGGVKSPEIYGSEYMDNNPNRFYDFNTKKKSVRTMDFYWF